MNSGTPGPWASAKDFTEALHQEQGDKKKPVKGGGSLTLTKIPSPLGFLWAGATSQGIALLEFDEEERLKEQVRQLRMQYSLIPSPGDSPFFDSLSRELEEYFGGRRQRFTLPLDIHGTPFQKAAWQALTAIPYGQTRTYGEQAATMGKPKAARGVGRANGANRVAILLPCHRVVGAGGKLTGYGGGLWRKKNLLEREQQPG